MSSRNRSQENKGKKNTESQLLDLKDQAKDAQRELRGILEREEPQTPDRDED